MSVTSCYGAIYSHWLPAVHYQSTEETDDIQDGILALEIYKNPITKSHGVDIDTAMWIPLRIALIVSGLKHATDAMKGPSQTTPS